MTMGINSIIVRKNMPAVVFAVILGAIIGMAIHLEERIEQGGRTIQKAFPAGVAGEENSTLFVTAIVLFCASGTGVYGSLVAGMSGDHSILIAKSILDLFTALIFACTLGIAVSAVALPQAIIFSLLFFLARVIYPLTTPMMIDDFKACGGVIMLATGLRMARIKLFNIADMIPALILVMPLSHFWSSFVLPLVS